MNNNLQTLNNLPKVKEIIAPAILHAILCSISTIMPVIILVNTIGLDIALKQNLIQNVFFISGVSTFIQTMAFKKLGARLPIIMGSNFTFLTTLITIALGKGYDVMLGSILIGGILSTILSFFSKYINNLITPLTKGLIVFAVGFSIISSSIINFAGGATHTFGDPKHLLIAIVTLLTVLGCETFSKGKVKNLAVIIGMIVGIIVAVCLQMIDYQTLEVNQIISFPKPYLHFQFDLESIIIVTLIYLVSTTEVISNTNALTIDTLNRSATNDEVLGSVTTTNLSSTIASLFGIMPVTVFAQNITVVKKTKIINRFAVGASSFLLILFSFFPVIASLIMLIPNSVLLGATLALFGTITITGLSLIYKCGLSERNISICAISLAFSIGLSITPSVLQEMPFIIQTLFTSPVSSVFLISSVLEILLPFENKNPNFKKILYGELVK